MASKTGGRKKGIPPAVQIKNVVYRDVSGNPCNPAYRFRKVVPSDCREKIVKPDGSWRRHWVHTWAAGTPLGRIETEAAALSRQYDNEIAVARGQAVSPDMVADQEAAARGWQKDTPADVANLIDFLYQAYPDGPPADVAVFLNALQRGGTYKPASITILEAFERDKAEHPERDPKPLAYGVRSFVKIVGDLDISEISRSQVSDWLKAQKSEGSKPGTISRRLGAVRAMVTRAYRDHEITRTSPFEGHKVTNGNGSVNDRVPFSKGHLELLEKYLATSQKMQGSDAKLVLEMMWLTGCGPGEIGGLSLADVALDTEIPFINIQVMDIRGLKTNNRPRRIPLIGRSLDAAKIAVEQAKARAGDKPAEKVQLFSTYDARPKSEGGLGASPLSLKLCNAIKAAGIPKSPYRLVPYSLRHTLMEAMRLAEVPEHVQRRLIGHGDRSISDQYGSRVSMLVDCKAAIEKAIPFFGDVDETIYRDFEKV